MPPAEVERLAAAFWERVGVWPPPPRDLEPLIPHVANVFIVPLPAPRRATVHAWLRQRRVILPLPGEDRPLRGFVVAYRGLGAIFIDEALPADERRVIVAHEFAHYLAEYDVPRTRIVRRLGPDLLPMLDGDRPLTDVEAWAGLLAGVPLGVHTHLLARESGVTGPELPPAERRANALALELLAPWQAVLTDCRTHNAVAFDSVQSRLVAKYGLPPAWANGYAKTIAETLTRSRSFTDHLGF